MKALKVFAAKPGEKPQKLDPPVVPNDKQAWNWTRTEIAEHLIGLAPDGVLARRGGPRPDARVGRNNEFRLCERWTSSAKSVFQFDVQGAVAKSTHAGIPWLKRIREAAGEHVHIWPFDGWTPAEGKAVIAEVYPSIFRH